MASTKSDHRASLRFTLRPGTASDRERKSTTPDQPALPNRGRTGHPKGPTSSYATLPEPLPTNPGTLALGADATEWYQSPGRIALTVCGDKTHDPTLS
jgi:hypothetical protein